MNGTLTRYYSFNGRRVAKRVGQASVSYLHADQLQSTTNSTGQTTSRPEYYFPYGGVRGGSEVATDYQYTGQRWTEVLGLYFYNARWYDPSIRRFAQPDTIVPEPGNPQSLNRYAYALNNPVRYNDPSGNDPLDQAWRDEFESVHHRQPGAEDILIRLFSVTFPEQWNSTAFYDAQGNYIQGSLEEQFRDNRPADWTWEDMPGALERLGSWYYRGEEELYTRDIGSLFGGLANRFESPDVWPTVSDPDNPIRVWVYLSRGGLAPSLMGTSDWDANVHHWAWALTMGAAYGPGGSLINTGRETTQFDGDWANSWSDIAVGNVGAALGFRFRVVGPGDTTRAWNEYMLGRWLR